MGPGSRSGMTGKSETDLVILLLFVFPLLFIFLFLFVFPLLFVFLFLLLFVVRTGRATCPYIVFAFNPLFGEEGNVPERHEGSSQFSKCLVVDFDFVFAFVFVFALDLAFVFALVFAVGWGPRRGVFFFGVPFLLDKQKKRYDLDFKKNHPDYCR